jgi:hypothetical protein
MANLEINKEDKEKIEIALVKVHHLMSLVINTVVKKRN